MRAPHKAQSSSAVIDGQTSRLLTRFVVAVVATGALLLVWRPSFVHAQDSTSVHHEQPPVVQAEGVLVPATQPPAGATTTHIVKAGETLWSIAARFYGDGHQWPALARSNRIPTNAERVLEVGMKLTVPAQPTVRGENAAAVAAAPADSTVPKVALTRAGEGTLPTPPKAGPLAAQTASKGNASAPERANPGRAASTVVSAAPKAPSSPEAPVDTGRVDLSPQRGTLLGSPGVARIGLVEQADKVASRKASEIETVFHRDLPDAAEAERRTRAALRPNTPAPRQAEFDAAPFVLSAAELAAGGVIDQRVGASENTPRDYPHRAIMTDDVSAIAPAGSSYKVGDRLISVTTRSQGQGKGKNASLIVVPTGVLVVVKAEPGQPVLASLTRQFGRVEQGQRLLPAPQRAGEWVQPAPLAAPDIATTVRWLDGGELMPTLQTFLLLGAGSTQGLQAGDEVALYRPAEGAAAELLTATARVVRVDGETSAAIITRQYAPDIAIGMAARRYAKAP